VTQVLRVDRPPLPLRGLAVGVAVVFATPVLYVLWRVVTLDAAIGDTFHDSVGPLWRTIQMALIVSVATGVLGTGLAWLLVRTDVPLARVWRLLAPLPLVFPSFIGAAAFIAGLAPDGVIRNALSVVGYDAPRRFRGLGASCFVLTAFTYPYVYLPVAARLSGLPPSIEESARLLGDRPSRLFFRIVLPAIRSSVLGGMLIALLYSFSEFGAVQLLGFDTLTRVVYATRLVDRAQSFAAATLLLVLAVVAVTIERQLRGSFQHSAPIGLRRNVPIALGRWRIPAVVSVIAVVFVSLVAPVVSLAQWAWRGLEQNGQPIATLGDELAALRDPAWATAWLGIIAAMVAVAVVLPAALLTVRYRSRLGPPVTAAVLAGFAVPGVVIALSLAFWALNVPHFDRLYQSTPLLISAYVVHFGAQAMRSTEVAVATVPRRVRESARLLGASPVRRALTVDLPLMRPGLVAGAGLVLLSTVKELPATLLLAPTGLETLATRVWGAFEGGFLGEAGLVSIVLVLASGVLTWLLVLRPADRAG
jgi:iron(III) transport system permease protein